MPDWFEDDEFWSSWYPYVFGEERFDQAEQEVEQFLALADMIRRHVIYRAGRLTKPQGKLKLTMSGNEATEKTFRFYLDALRFCA